MDINLITSVAVAMKENGLTLVELTEGTMSLRLERACSQTVPATPVPAAVSSELPPLPAEPAPDLEKAVDFNRLTEIKSPMVGIFYEAPAPDAEPFIKVGSRVKKGDVLCVIEAMKLMNEITAENDGEIVDICVTNGQVVEFSQVLFRVF